MSRLGKSTHSAAAYSDVSYLEGNIAFYPATNTQMSLNLPAGELGAGGGDK